MAQKPKEHSILSASSSERWWNCPGSVKACENLPNPTSQYAAEGTVAHHLAEQMFAGIAIPQVGEIVEQEGFEIEVTEEMVEAVETYVGYVNKIVSLIGNGAVVRIEEKITLKEVHAVLFGTGDVVIIEPFKCVHIIDLKYGAGKRVSAYRNKQLMQYALGVMLKEDCLNFVIHIVQPRVEDGITSYAGDITEMDEYHAELVIKVKAALDPKAPLIPGDWCKSSFCPNRATCTALQSLSTELAGKDFGETPIVETLSMAQILKVLKYEDTIKDWMSKVRDHAKELLLQGVDMPGYKVVKSVGNAVWIDETAVIAEFEPEFGDKLYEKKFLSPAKLEKLVGKKKLGDDFRDEYTRRPDNGYKIVEADEKGETVKLTKAQEDF
jgi:hypothetical protein